MVIKIPFGKMRVPSLLAVSAIVWLAVSLMVCACGRKGPPEPPRGGRPPAISDLRYRVSGNTIELSWTVPQTGDKDILPATGVLIYRSKETSGQAECPSCPIKFEEIGDVPVAEGAAGRAQPQRAVFSHEIETGYRYIYKANTYNKDGVVGRDSNFVEFIY